jgi:hypothetical protein
MLRNAHVEYSLIREYLPTSFLSPKIPFLKVCAAQKFKFFFEKIAQLGIGSGKEDLPPIL